MKTLDLQPTLTAKQIALRPLQLADLEALHAAASDPEIWQQHPDANRYQRDVFEQRLFEGAIASGSALAVIDLGSGKIVGSSRFYEWLPEQREIAIGYTFLARSHWGNGSNLEMKALMLQHVSGFADTVSFHVGEENHRSRRAVEKLGAKLSHSESRELDGKPFVQLYYKLGIAQGLNNIAALQSSQTLALAAKPKQGSL